MRGTYVPGQEKMDVQPQTEKFHPSSMFLFYSDPQWIALCLSTLVRVNFIQAADSNALSSGNIIIGTQRNNVLPVT